MEPRATVSGCFTAVILAGCVVSSSPGASSFGPIECGEGDVPAAERYLERVVAETGERWAVPAGLEGADLVWIHIILDPQGRVVGAAATSGDERLAESALRALRERTPTEPPPACLVGLDVAVRFDNPAHREGP